MYQHELFLAPSGKIKTNQFRCVICCMSGSSHQDLDNVHVEWQPLVIFRNLTTRGCARLCRLGSSIFAAGDLTGIC